MIKYAEKSSDKSETKVLKALIRRSKDTRMKLRYEVVLLYLTCGPSTQSLSVTAIAGQYVGARLIGDKYINNGSGWREL